MHQMVSNPLILSLYQLLQVHIVRSEESEAFDILLTSFRVTAN